MKQIGPGTHSLIKSPPPCPVCSVPESPLISPIPITSPMRSPTRISSSNVFLTTASPNRPQVRSVGLFGGGVFPPPILTYPNHTTQISTPVPLPSLTPLPLPSPQGVMYREMTPRTRVLYAFGESPAKDLDLINRAVNKRPAPLTATNGAGGFQVRTWQIQVMEI